jgi:L-ascorbate metabolism protein UlaG (beta-lactamase superfamily)
VFDIEYKGANGIVITTKKATAVIDPKLSVAGLKDLSVKDTVEIATEARLAVNDKSSLITIEGPGDYEIADFSISGIPATRHIDTPDVEKKSTIYRIEVGDIRIALLGNIAPELSDNQMEELGVIDVLIIPIGGGGYTLDATSAATLVRHIDPKAVIPIHYNDDGIKYEVPQDTFDVFVKELGAPLETTGKYKLKGASSLPAVVTIIQVTRT